MRTKYFLSYNEIRLITEAATKEARENGWSVTISVVDDGGHPLSLIRMDQVAPISSYIAFEKAKTAALGRRDTKGYEDMVNGGRFAFISAPQVTPLEGGVAIIFDGQVVGAIGVSGVKAEQDAQVAQAGARAIA